MIRVVDTMEHRTVDEVDTGAQVVSALFLGRRNFVVGLGGFESYPNVQLWRYLPEPPPSGTKVPRLESLFASGRQEGRILGVAKDPTAPFLASLSDQRTLCIWKLKPPATRTPPLDSLLDRMTIR
jgi:hypothetical protein